MFAKPEDFTLLSKTEDDAVQFTWIFPKTLEFTSFFSIRPIDAGFQTLIFPSFGILTQEMRDEVIGQFMGSILS